MVTNYVFPNPVKVEPLVKENVIIAVPDREYVVEGAYIHFDELVLHGLLVGATYRGHRLTMLYAYEQVGQIVDMRGARGPALRGALFRVDS